MNSKYSCRVYQIRAIVVDDDSTNSSYIPFRHKHTNTFVITSNLKSMRLTRTKRPSSKPKRRFQTSLGSWHPLQVHQNLPISQRPTSLELAEEKQRSTNKKAKCSIKSTLRFFVNKVNITLQEVQQTKKRLSLQHHNYQLTINAYETSTHYFSYYGSYISSCKSFCR